ncbi:MAG: hypothetical protein JO081_07900 [Alphaproteobacteria bacterium]|nr:hypothetical protein [Alphaproteobacteria bacterium]
MRGRRGWGVARHPVDPTRVVGILRLDQTKTLFDLDQIRFHFCDITTNGAPMSEHQVDALAADDGDIEDLAIVQQDGRRERESNP